MSWDSFQHNNISKMKPCIWSTGELMDHFELVMVIQLHYWTPDRSLKNSEPKSWSLCLSRTHYFLCGAEKPHLQSFTCKKPPVNTSTSALNHFHQADSDLEVRAGTPLNLLLPLTCQMGCCGSPLSAFGWTFCSNVKVLWLSNVNDERLMTLITRVLETGFGWRARETWSPTRRHMHIRYWQTILWWYGGPCTHSPIPHKEPQHLFTLKHLHFE